MLFLPGLSPVGGKTITAETPVPMLHHTTIPFTGENAAADPFADLLQNPSRALTKLWWSVAPVGTRRVGWRNESEDRSNPCRVGSGQSYSCVAHCRTVLRSINVQARHGRPQHPDFYQQLGN